MLKWIADFAWGFDGVSNNSKETSNKVRMEEVNQMWSIQGKFFWIVLAIVGNAASPIFAFLSCICQRQSHLLLLCDISLQITPSMLCLFASFPCLSLLASFFLLVLQCSLVLQPPWHCQAKQLFIWIRVPLVRIQSTRLRGRGWVLSSFRAECFAKPRHIYFADKKLTKDDFQWGDSKWYI